MALTIGDHRVHPCPQCHAMVEWYLRQRIVGPLGMQAAHGLWQVDEHPVGGEEALEKKIAAGELAEDAEVPFCPPITEPVYDEVEGEWNEDQRMAMSLGKGFDPRTDPLMHPASMTRWDDPHISCVMPTTIGRLWCMPRAIRCWLKQTWPGAKRDLLIVSDEKPGVAPVGPDDATQCEMIGREIEKTVTAYAKKHDLDYEINRKDDGSMPSFPRFRLDRVTVGDTVIRHIHLPPPTDGIRFLGEKYNDCIAAAEGPFVALWADDDWHSPKRLDVVMRAMQGHRCAVGGTNTMLAYRMADKSAFMFWSPGERPYVISGTMIFSKELWEAVGKFPHQRRASDSAFIARLLWGTGVVWANVNDPRLYIAFVHGANTGNPLGDANQDEKRMFAFEKLEGEDADMARHLGADAAAFGF